MWRASFGSSRRAGTTDPTHAPYSLHRFGNAASSESVAYPYPDNLLSAVIAARLCGLNINRYG